MAGLNPKNVRDALATALTTALTAGSVGVYAYAPRANPNDLPGYPSILIGHAEGTDAAITFGASGIAELRLEIEVRTMSADGISAEQELDGLIAAGTGATASVYDALMGLGTLSGNISSLRIVGFSPPRPLPPMGSGQWSATYTIAVTQSRS